MEKIIVGIDPGLNGHIVFIIETNGKLIGSLKMPTKKIILSHAKKKKVGTYKNGKPKYKITKKEKSRKILDVVNLYEEISFISNTLKSDFILKIIIEKQSGMAGNAARSSSTISFNYGQIIGITKILKFVSSIEDYEEVSPQTWKRSFGLLGIKDKNERKEASIIKAKELGYEPKTHDEAEAMLIANYYINTSRNNNERN